MFKRQVLIISVLFILSAPFTAFSVTDSGPKHEKSSVEIKGERELHERKALEEKSMMLFSCYPIKEIEAAQGLPVDPSN